MTRLRLGPVTLHWGSKDGGPESRVRMYGIECKALASVLVLRFEDGSRDAYHSHAFNAVSVVAGPGELTEFMDEGITRAYWQVLRPSVAPVFTARARCHKVVSHGTTWVLSLRGPWARTWVDIDATTGEATTLTSGRVRVAA